VDLHSSFEECDRVQATKNDLRIGQRDFGATSQIRARSGHRTCADRSDFEGAGIVKPGNAAAASTYDMDVEHGHANRIPGHFAAGGELGAPLGDQGYVGAGTADVEGNYLRLPYVGANPR